MLCNRTRFDQNCQRELSRNKRALCVQMLNCTDVFSFLHGDPASDLKVVEKLSRLLCKNVCNT